jgi:hypothetical protein
MKHDQHGAAFLTIRPTTAMALIKQRTAEPMSIPKADQYRITNFDACLHLFCPWLGARKAEQAGNT